jgi:hypothetical protein
LSQGSPLPHNDKPNFTELTHNVQAEAAYHETVERLNNPPALRTIQEQRIKDANDTAKAAEIRAKQLEDARLKAIEEGAAAAQQETAAERARREEAEKNLAAEKARTLQGQIENLRTDIQRFATSGTGQKGLVEQFQEIKALVKEMGLSNPAGAQDATIQLEITRLQMQDAREARAFQKQMRDSDREWDLKLQQLASDNNFRKEELAIKKQQGDMFANLPKLLGSAIGQGFAARAEALAGAGAASGAIAGQPAKVNTIVAGEGEAGEVECPDCHTLIGVAPTTKSTICAGCGIQYMIKREPRSEPAPSPTPPKNANVGTVGSLGTGPASPADEAEREERRL